MHSNLTDIKPVQVKSCKRHKSLCQRAELQLMCSVDVPCSTNIFKRQGFTAQCLGWYPKAQAAQSGLPVLVLVKQRLNIWQRKANLKGSDVLIRTCKPNKLAATQRAPFFWLPQRNMSRIRNVRNPSGSVSSKQVTSTAWDCTTWLDLNWLVFNQLEGDSS